MKLAWLGLEQVLHVLCSNVLVPFDHVYISIAHAHTQCMHARMLAHAHTFTHTDLWPKSPDTISEFKQCDSVTAYWCYVTVKVVT